LYSRFVNTKLDTGLQIGTVAVRSGLTVDTIRFYEKQGLVSKPHRSTGGFRLYDDRDLDRLSFVGRAQALGFWLVEIRELLLLQDAGAEACTHVHDLLDHKLANVQQKIADLKKLESQLKSARKRCDLAAAKECNGSCPVIDEIAGSRKEVQ
jgi:DNA-binding transcriptional MerR regulator